MLVKESIENLFSPKSEKDIVRSVFKGTKLEFEDPYKVYYLKINTMLGSLGEDFLRANNINYEKMKDNYYIIWGTLIELIQYYNNIDWGKNEIKLHLERNVIPEKN